MQIYLISAKIYTIPTLCAYLLNFMSFNNIKIAIYITLLTFICIIVYWKLFKLKIFCTRILQNRLLFRVYTRIATYTLPMIKSIKYIASIKVLLILSVYIYCKIILKFKIYLRFLKLNQYRLYYLLINAICHTALIFNHSFKALIIIIVF